MKKIIVNFCCCAFFCFAAVSSFAQNDKGSFQLVHWNILKVMYDANSFIHANKMTAQQLVDDPVFKKITTDVYTPDSYTVILDQSTTYYAFPQNKLVGKKLSTLKDGEQALRIIQKAIDGNQCARGFYVWIDQQEKYLVACPLVGTTTDGHKLYYAYTMHTRSMPEYYVKTLKNSVLK